MDFLRWPNSLPTRELYRKVALESSVLGNLPVDVLLKIVEYFPPLAAAAFAMTSMQIQHLVGPKYLRSMQISDVMDFLNLVARDLPDHIACPCLRLHPIADASKYRGCERQTRARLGKSYDSTIFCMAIKRYHQGASYTELLNMMSSEAQTKYKRKNTEEHPPHLRLGYMKQSKTVHRIKQGILLQRRQRIFLHPRSIHDSQWYGTIKICSHMQAVMITGKPRIHCTCLSLCRPDWLDDFYLHLREFGPLGNSSTPVVRCRHCPTELTFGMKDYKYSKRGHAFFMTTWKDLGDSPESEFFLQSGGFSDWLAEIVDEARPATAQTKPGTIAEAFGDGEDYKFDSLLMDPMNWFKLSRMPRHSPECGFVKDDQTDSLNCTHLPRAYRHLYRPTLGSSHIEKDYDQAWEGGDGILGVESLDCERYDWQP
jgi:hypothetical protein